MRARVARPRQALWSARRRAGRAPVFSDRFPCQIPRLSYRPRLEGLGGKDLQPSLWARSVAVPVLLGQLRKQGASRGQVVKKMWSTLLAVAVIAGMPTAAYAVNASSNDGSGEQHVVSWTAIGANLTGYLKSTAGRPVYFQGASTTR